MKPMQRGHFAVYSLNNASVAKRVEVFSGRDSIYMLVKHSSSTGLVPDGLM